MNQNQSGKFFVGSLVTFAILYGIIQILLSCATSLGKSMVTPESMAPEAIVERIKPVAEVNVGEPPAVEAPAVEEETADAAGPAQTIVNQVCAACHAAGLMSSPKLGSAADWSPRIDKGIDTLYDNAINGFNMMPARGGRPDLSDDDVKAAVDYMVSQAK